MPSAALTREELSGVISAAANTTGGWGYYPGKASRIEPTCWAMLALSGETAASAAGAGHQFLAGCQRSDGLLSDRSDLPSNSSWSALTFLTLSALSTSFPSSDFRERLLEAVVKSGGVQLANSPQLRQNNRLKGWSWTPGTFSWAEPTSWCLLALKRAVRASADGGPDVILRRIAEGEALLADRVCESGGWNFGNANVHGQNLPAHIPTTALGLLALQDKPESHVVQRSLAFVEEHWRKELSGTALALSLICLRIYGRATGELEAAMMSQWERTSFLGNLATASMACCALNMSARARSAFSLRT